MVNVFNKVFLLLTLLFCMEVIGDFQPAPEPHLVSNTELDAMSPGEIPVRYPSGLSAITSTMSPELKYKLEQLKNDGYTVRFINSDSDRLQLLVQQAVERSNLPAFLQKAYGEGSECPGYFEAEFIPYVMRIDGKPAIQKITSLNQQTRLQLEQVYMKHHFWNNLGYDNITDAADYVKDWIVSASLAMEEVNKEAFARCQVMLNPAQLEIAGKLVALDYLSNTVRSLFYSQQGGYLTTYRQMAMESLNKTNK